MKSPLILASESPRRHELLRQLDRPFQIRPVPVDETPPPGTPRAAAEAIALRKARAAAQGLSRGIVLGADTLVEVSGTILGKPEDAADALRMLGLLSATRHCVHTGIAAIDTGSGRELSSVCTTEVWMRPIAVAERRAYVDSGEPFGKAGGYAVQETGDRFVERMEGPYDNVVGLPVEQVRELLARLEAPRSLS